MIKKLRIKFTAAAMLSVVTVLVIILGTANILNYRKVIADADNVLSMLTENNGTFPDMSPRKNGKPKPDTSPEIPYESRFFSVHFNSDGQITSTDTGKIAAIDSETAQEYADQVMNSSKLHGFISDYRFMKHSSQNDTMVIFLDCNRNLSTFRNFLMMSILVSAAGVLAVFLLVILLSKRIVRPFAESYEKQKRFITDAGHELKTPLTIIDADAAVLEMESGENEWLKDIQKQTSRLKDLTNDLIYLSKMEESQNNLQMVEFPVSDNVAVINAGLAAEVMGRMDVTGETIRFNGVDYLIVGVLMSDASDSSTLETYEAYIPYTSLVRLTDDVSSEITSFCVSASSEETMDEAEAALTETLMERFSQDEDAFTVMNQSTIMKAMESVNNTLALLLGGIAAISLLVGGIGIMNIMLVSVTERTREIGIRKAIGAGRGTIMLQFLIEALMLSLLGCALGILLSWITLQVIGAVGGQDTAYSLSMGVVWISIAFSVAIGVSFGIYPANKAARKKPIDALRYTG